MVDKLDADLQVNVTDNLRAGVSSNIVLVTSTTNGEVIIDFIFAHPNDIDIQNNVQRGTLVSRVVLPIKVARDLNMIMSSQLGKPKPE